MGLLTRLVAGAFLLAPLCFARPFIFHRSIVNAASFTPQGLPNGAIARGAIFSIFGRDLGPATGVSAPALPLQTTLAGVSVRICKGTTDCISAYPLFVFAGQINAVMPSNAPLGSVNVIVRYNNEDGNFSPTQVTDTAFGTFAVSSAGFGPGIITSAQYAVNSADATFKPGQTVILWGTGLGAALNADNVAPTVGDLPVEVEIWVGGISVTRKLYSGRSPEFPGLDQIAFEIPSNAPTGCYVPVVLRTARRATSNSTTVAISSNGACSDPSSPLSAARAGGRTGVVLLHRLNTASTSLNVNFSADMISAAFQDESSGPWHFNRMYSLPPVGACITSAAVSATLDATLLANLVANGTRLDAGEHISVTGPASSAEAEILPAARNFYGGAIGSDYGLQPLMSLFFGNGSTRVSSTGGPDVGAFQIDLTPVAAIALTDPNLTIQRGSDSEVRWSGGDPQGLALVVGFARAKIAASTAMFACVERASIGHITVPDWATAHFPSATGPADTLLGIFALPATATRFTATGLDNGLGLFINGQLRSVDIR